MRALGRLRCARGRRGRRSHGGLNFGSLRPGEVRRGFHAGDIAKLQIVLGSIEELLSRVKDERPHDLPYREVWKSCSGKAIGASHGRSEERRVGKECSTQR